MSTAASIESTASILTQAPVGSRLWFWFCPDLPPDQPTLLLSTLDADPGMDTLNAAAGTLQMPLGGRLFMGLASVSVNGTLRFGAPGLGAKTLAELADWTGTHLASHPGLARLKDASFLNIQADGVIAGVHESAVLWAGVPHMPVAGTIEGTAVLLNALSEGQDAWFWMSDIGGGGGPAATAVLVDEDPTGRAFRGQVRAIRGEGKAFSGVLRPLDADRLAMTTTGDLDQGVRIITTLMDSHSATLTRLEGARLVRMSGGRFVAARTIERKASGGGCDLSRQVAVLQEMGAGGKALFWFTQSANNGEPILVLEQEPGALKKAAKKVQGSDRGMRGQVRVTARGWLEFRSRKTINDFIPALAGWAVANRGEWSGLTRLRGARLTVRNDDDEIVSRHKDDDVWKALV